MSRQRRNSRTITAIAGILVIMVNVSVKAQPLERLEHCSISFTGTASGGNLVLCETLNRNARFACLTTTRGETAESVLQRLASLINDQAPFEWGKGRNLVSAKGGTIDGLLGTHFDYIIAGTETGLGIPNPPTSLTCNYNPESKNVTLRWINPPGNYDSIRIVLNWDNYDHRGEIAIPGNSESYVLDLNKRSADMVNDVDIWVFGVAKGVPSNAAAMHVSGRMQEELFGIPFTSDIAPNWTSWSTEGIANKVIFEQAVRENYIHLSQIESTKRSLQRPRYNAVRTPETKPFVQVIRNENSDIHAGVWRKFLGLTPGHTYKISARLNTLRMDSNNPDWSFSLYAVADKGTDELIANQMAGLAALPNGKTSPEAGRIAFYGLGTTTKGKYATDKARIVVPADSDAITVWLRITGKTPSGVAFDYISLEDITPAN